MDVASWPLVWIVVAFAGAAATIGIAGTTLTGVAERLARDTGLGQAVFGAVFLGGATSLPEVATSVTAAAGGHASLAVSNAIGGVAAQTVFLAVADTVYPKANLEHAAANPANLMQGALLVTLLALPILGVAAPGFTVWAIHPASFLVVAAYVFGIHLLRRASSEGMWVPKRTAETAPPEDDEPAPGPRRRGSRWIAFVILAAVAAGAGYVVAITGEEIAAKTGLGESFVGTFLTAISTSLPELVIAVAAVRRGALTLAVGDVLGGNCFDVVIVAISDAAFRDGSIYAAVGAHELFVTALTILLTGVLLLGLLRRERHGIANIGFESFLIFVLYVACFVYLFYGGV